MAETANSVYRDFVTEGVPASGKHEPYKPEIRRLLTGYETIINAFTSNGGLIYSSKAAMDADLAKAANTMAWVVGDATAANNGIYRKIGASGSGSWGRAADLPFSFIVASDVGAGTPNAVVATTSIPVTSSALVWLNIFEANTASPVTVSFNGGSALTIKTNTGNDVAVGGLTSGMIVMGIVSGSTFRLVSDQASAGLVAAAEGFANIALAAANANLVFITKAAAGSSTISASIHSVSTKGGVAEGDGLGGLYIDSNNGSADTFTSNGGTRTWYRAADIGYDRLVPALTLPANLTVTVGSGGNYATVNAALKDLSRKQIREYASLGRTVVIQLLTGFVMAEQVLVSGVDLSYITITSVDAVVLVNPAAITSQLAGADTGEPIFGVTNRGSLPTIGVQFEYQTQQSGTKAGVAVFNGSKATFLPGSGVRKGARGLAVFYGSEAVCAIPGLRDSSVALPGVYGVDFSNTAGRALDVHNNSRVTLPRSKFNDSGNASNSAVYGIWNAYLDLMQGQAKNCLATDTDEAGVRVRDGSFLCMREGDVSGSLGNGLYISHATKADFRQSPTGPMSSLGARNCALYGVYAGGGCEIDATDLVATNCGAAGVAADSASTIHALRADVSRSGGCTTPIGFLASKNSRVNAALGKADGCAVGVQAEDCGEINFNGGTAIGCATAGVLATRSSNINFDGGTATGCGIGMDIQRGSQANARSAVCTGYTGSAGIRANGGSRVEGNSANARKAGIDTVTDFVVASGSIIDANSRTGGVSQTVNTVTASGIIFG